MLSHDAVQPPRRHARHCWHQSSVKSFLPELLIWSTSSTTPRQSLLCLLTILHPRVLRCISKSETTRAGVSCPHTCAVALHMPRKRHDELCNQPAAAAAAAGGSATANAARRRRAKMLRYAAVGGGGAAVVVGLGVAFVAGNVAATVANLPVLEAMEAAAGGVGHLLSGLEALAPCTELCGLCAIC